MSARSLFDWPLRRRGLMMEIHIDLHADEQRSRIGELNKNVGDAEIAEIA
jgi:hypothetical protein